jgi:hypothetical protein
MMLILLYNLHFLLTTLIVPLVPVMLSFCTVSLSCCFFWFLSLLFALGHYHAAYFWFKPLLLKFFIAVILLFCIYLVIFIFHCRAAYFWLNLYSDF